MLASSVIHRATRRLAGTLVLVSAVLAGSSAAAQGYAVNRFEPSERGSDWFAGESLDLRGRARPLAGVVTDWSYRPLVLRRDGAPDAVVITDQVFIHTGAGVVFGDRFRAAFSLPVAVYQNGETSGAFRGADKPAVSDLRLTADARLAGEYGDLARVAVGLQIFAPTGMRSLFTSDGTIRVAPRFLIAGDYKGFAYAAKLGFAYRPSDRDVFGRRLGSEGTFAVSAGLKVNDRFIVGPELYGAVGVTGPDAFGARATALGGLLGTHFVLGDDWRFGNGIGTALTNGDGAADLRVVVSFEYAPDVCVDKDGDGICERQDACPLVPGIRTRVRATNGCPRPGDDTPKMRDEAPGEPAKEPAKESEPEDAPPAPTDLAIDPSDGGV